VVTSIGASRMTSRRLQISTAGYFGAVRDPRLTDCGTTTEMYSFGIRGTRKIYLHSYIEAREGFWDFSDAFRGEWRLTGKELG
jgi:hypothetical protein